MMKQNVYFLLLLLVSMIIFSQASGRFLANNLQVEEELKLLKRTNDGDHSIDKMGTTNLNRLMGLEEYSCEDENDQECIKRRVLEEAHLDYIYTQHHNHP